MTPDFKIKCLIIEYEFELEDSNKKLEDLLTADVIDLISVSKENARISLIEKFLKELNH